MTIESAIRRLRELLIDIGWSPEQIESGAFHIDFGPPHLPISTGLAAIIRDAAQLVIYVNFGFLVPAEKREEILRFIARTNWDLIIGNFELDLTDGHVRFKSSVDFEGIDLDERLIRNALLGAMEAVDAHADVLMKLALS